MPNNAVRGEALMQSGAKTALAGTVLQHHWVNLSGRLFAFDLKDLFTPIRSAFRADAMGDMILAAALALHQMLECQGVMGAATIPPGLRNFSLR